jgi:hypothetical protein
MLHQILKVLMLLVIGGVPDVPLFLGATSRMLPKEERAGR